jgi:hypothetical protein
MKSKSLCAMILLGYFTLAGCGPVNSLFSLYTNDDKFLDENLIGEWRQAPETAPESDRNMRWVFLRDGDSNVYKSTLGAIGGRGVFLAKARLVRLGNSLFVDFQGDTDSISGEDTPVPYPIIQSHAIGRIWIEKEVVRIHFLNDDWVKQQLKAGKLTLAHAGPDDDPVLNASTAELRKFALEHADDKEAFSENYELARVK